MAYACKKDDPLAGLSRRPLPPSSKDFLVFTKRDRWLTGMTVVHTPTGLRASWDEKETLPRRLSYAEAYERLVTALKNQIADANRNKNIGRRQ